MVKKTLVLGGSENVHRYSNMAIKKLHKNGHEVCAIGAREGNVAAVFIATGQPKFKDINTITLYLNAKRQLVYYDYILSLKPQRVIFNPGTENAELALLLEREGVNWIEACTLVLLSTNQY